MNSDLFNHYPKGEDPSVLGKEKRDTNASLCTQRFAIGVLREILFIICSEQRVNSYVFYNSFLP